jgi:hypothetical protein
VCNCAVVLAFVFHIFSPLRFTEGSSPKLIRLLIRVQVSVSGCAEQGFRGFHSPGMYWDTSGFPNYDFANMHVKANSPMLVQSLGRCAEGSCLLACYTVSLGK